jgi:hypothetical protein
MKKRFTPEQVKNGKVVYTFEAFLNDLWEDVESTLSKEYSKKMSDKEQQDGKHEEIIRDVFNFVYELCYLAAMNNPELKLMLERVDTENRDIVQKTLISNKENIALLHAIFMRRIANRLEQGLTKRQAVKATIEESKSVFTNWMK